MLETNRKKEEAAPLKHPLFISFYSNRMLVELTIRLLKVLWTFSSIFTWGKKIFSFSQKEMTTLRLRENIKNNDNNDKITQRKRTRERKASQVQERNESAMKRISNEMICYESNAKHSQKLELNL